MKAGKTVAVLGAGTMGAGMAAQYALYGSEVMLYSRTEETLERARKTIENACALLGETGAVTPEMAAAAPGLVGYTTDVATAVEKAWYVVETIAERADAKTALYQQLDTLLGEDVILASNTSYMDIFKLIPPLLRGRTTPSLVMWSGGSLASRAAAASTITATAPMPIPCASGMSSW